MNIYSKNHSSYPRVGDTPELQRLRKAYNMLDKGKITTSEVANILDETVELAISEQLESDCDFITDGQIRTFDPLSYLAGKIDGFEITGLLRFFDTNYLYRQPKVTGKLSTSIKLIVDDYLFTAEQADSKASAVMFGPYSLLKMSNCEHDFESRLEELIAIYAVELIALKEAGATLIQLDEPAIVHHPEDIALFKTTYGSLYDSTRMPRVLIAFYFGDITPHVDKFSDINADGLLFDFTYSPGLTDRLSGFDKNIGLGIIDGRNTKMENPDKTAKTAESILGKVKSENVYITSSCGLEFLPRNRAFDKLKLASETTLLLRDRTFLPGDKTDNITGGANNE